MDDYEDEYDSSEEFLEYDSLCPADDAPDGGRLSDEDEEAFQEAYEQWKEDCIGIPWYYRDEPPQRSDFAGYTERMRNQPPAQNNGCMVFLTVVGFVMLIILTSTY